MSIFQRKRYPFEVVVHLDGRHPYLASNELDFPTRDVTLTVPARNWNDAEKQAFKAAINIRDVWTVSIKSIARVRP